MSARSPVEPNIAIRPGEHLEEELASRSLTVRALADLVGHPIGAINEVVRGAQPLSAELALDLEAALGMPSEVWVNLEAHYRATLRRLSRESFGR
ncbi:MAG: transcriptional regulator [Chloroflexi bacterium]|nr:transcriptional regulator [Chloroflexota bacterium]